jgi:sugar lactone lactonase YvrE
MLFRKNIVSMRTLLQLTVASVFLVGGVGAALAANVGVAPELVPYTVIPLAGNQQPTTSANNSLPGGGFGGDNGPAFATPTSGATVTATFNAPNALALDSAGNIYIADTSNAVIREINAATGIIKTVAGVPPTGCAGYQSTACSKLGVGCADGVAALNNPIGGNIKGLAVDGNGNIYFADSSQFTISVVYHGGAQVANFIQLVDPAGVTKAGGVIQGYVYHVAGSINLTSCVGVKGNVDNVLAFQNAQLSNTSGQIAVDGAGNVYIQDVGDNVVRVINTQSTPQQFFQSTVAPGFMRAIVDCSGALTVLCPTVVTPTAGTGVTLPPGTAQNPSTAVDGPANAVTYNTQTGMGVDGYGNIYQVDNKNATPAIYAQAVYAGGAPLAKLEGLEWKGVNIAYGDAYEVMNDMSLNTSLPHWFDQIPVNSDGSVNGAAIVRPTAITADPLGNVWAMDNHWPSIFRVDANSQILTDLIGFGGGNGGQAQIPTGKSNSGVYGSYTGTTGVTVNGVATGAIPCVTSIGSPFFSTPFGPGPLTYDGRLDWCPAKLSTLSGNGEIISDGYGNIYNADPSNQEIRVLSLDNTFPSTAVAALEPGGICPATASCKVTQPIQVHFDASNPPTIVGFTTTAFSFTPGISDYSIDTTDPNFQALLWFPAAYATAGAANSVTANTIALYAGPPSCIQNAAAVGDASWDCLVYVTFAPTAPGLRETQLVATTSNGGIYYFPLTGTGTGGQISIDGGQQASVPATGLGTTSSVAVASTGAIYIADAANNRIVVCTPGSGSLCKTQATLPLTIPEPSGAPTALSSLSGPMGVAVDSDLNIYISDTGNNRILEVNPITNVATTLGAIPWVSCAPTQNANSGFTKPASPCPLVAPGQLPPANSNLGSAQGVVTPGPMPVYNPLQQYLFKGPQGIAVDLNGNVYVADTGNSAIVEIPRNPVLGGANALFQYKGAPTFVSPVGVAVDPLGNVYVADTGNPFQQVVKIAPGGGDMQNLLPLGSSLPLIGGQSIGTPSGVAVDTAGNVFISDSTANVVWEAPAAGPPNGNPFILSYTGLSSPAGIGIDSGGNLYVADSGNKQIVYMNRQNPIASFGIVPMDLAPSGLNSTPAGCLQGGSATVCTGVLTITNSGTTNLPLTEPIETITGGALGFAVTTSCGSVLNVGATCTISPTFQPVPTAFGPQSATLTIMGSQTIALVANGNGGPPPAKIVIAPTYSGGSPAPGGTATYTATVTQPHASNTPTGTVTFTVLIDNGLYTTGSCGANPVIAPVTLVGGVAATTLPLVQGRIYTVTATYNGDPSDASADSNLITTTTPPIAITATAASSFYSYGAKPAAITGTITGVDSTVTATLVSGASQYSAVSGSPYPVTVALTGGDYCNYGNPAVYNPGTTTQATVTENPVTLNDTLPTFMSQYGAPDINYALSLIYLGAVNGDNSKFTASFSPAHSSTLSVAGSPYTITPSFSGKPITTFHDYTVATVGGTPALGVGTLTITQAPSQIGTGGTTAFNATTTTGSPTITALTSSFGLVAGGIVAGTGIPTGTTVKTISGSTITLSANATANATSSAPVSVTFTAGAKSFVPTTAGLITGTLTVTASTAVSGGVGLPTGGSGAITVYDTLTPILPGAPGLGVPILPCTLPFTAATTSGSPAVTVATAYDLFAGEGVTGPGIPAGTTIASTGVTSITLSATATATAGYVLLTSVNPLPTCNAPLPLAALTNGAAIFTPSSTAEAATLGLHQYVFAYTGDTNFLPSVLAPATISSAVPACAPASLTANCQLVDDADFVMTSTTGVLSIVPGVTPSGNGLLSAPGQNSSYPGSAAIVVTSLLSETGTVNVSCLPIGNPIFATVTAGSSVLTAVSINSTLATGQTITAAGIPTGATITAINVIAGTVTLSAPATASAINVIIGYITPPPANAGTAQSYIQCSMTPPALTLTANGTSTSVLSVFTPATEPIGYQYFSKVRMPGSETVLAFLPLGMLAFCMRRRRRLSKALWMLFAIAVFTVGMSGCGGNLVDFYAPVPQGQQYVQVTATGASITSGAVGSPFTRTFLVTIYIN